MDPESLYDRLVANHVPWGIAIALVVVVMMFRVPGATSFARGIFRAKKSDDPQNLGQALGIMSKMQRLTDELRDEFNARLLECERRHEDCERDRINTRRELEAEIQNLSNEVGDLKRAMGTR